MFSVSILIPTYNSGKRLKACLDSVINQTFQDFEVLICDGGSIDNTHEIINEYLKIDNRIKFYQTNKGVSNQRNLLISKSSCKYILFVDSDDTLDKHCVNKLFNKMLDGFDIVSPNMIVIDDKGDKTVGYKISEEHIIINKNNFFKYLDSHGLLSPQKMYKKSVINNTKFNINLAFGEDALFNYNIMSKKKYKYCIDITALYFVYRPLNYNFSEKYNRYFANYIKELYKLFCAENDNTIKKKMLLRIYEVMQAFFCSKYFLLYFFFVFRFKLIKNHKYLKNKIILKLLFPISYRILLRFFIKR